MTQQKWIDLLKKELKVDDPTRFLRREWAPGHGHSLLATDCRPAGILPSATPALSLTWSQRDEVRWGEVAELVRLGVWDFIFDPWLLGLSAGETQAQLAEASAALSGVEARLWVVDPGPGPVVGRPLYSAREAHAQGAPGSLELALLVLKVARWAQSPQPQEIGVALYLEREFFFSIAKLRALKLMALSVLERLAKPELAAKLSFVARVSWREFTAFDASNNILRTSNAVAAGLMAGAHVVEALPFDLLWPGPSSEAARRLCLTTQLILQNESTLGEVQDPAAGSFAIEELTEALIQESWPCFQQLSQLDEESRSAQVEALSRAHFATLAKAMHTRRLVQTGVNDFPQAERVLLAERWQRTDHVRLARDFEELRLALVAAPKVTLLRLGDSASLEARLNFTRNFFELLGCATETLVVSLEDPPPVTGVCAWVARDEDHAKLTAVGERCYLAGRTAVAPLINIFAGMDVLAALRDLAQWHQERL